MKTENILKISIIFLLGFLTANLMGYYFIYGLEVPFSDNFNLSSNQSPSDFIKQDQIQVFNDKIIINIDDASISSYAPTGSMIPVMDQGANGIRVKPLSESDINAGDIISFERYGKLVVHRVVEKAEDEEGTYFITKGDNNNLTDGKVRFKDIRYITIGVIW